jgi:DMSO reductase family type II enzyme chaperone
VTGIRSASSRLLDRAEFARLLARGFVYPDAELMASLKSREYFARLDELAALLEEGIDVGGPADSVAGQGYDLPGLQSEYTRLFARNVPCPLNASAYGADGVGAVHDLARTAAFYGAFGFRVSTRARELPDHLCIQLEFLGVLCAKEAFAIDNGWGDRAAICADARTRFAAEHMAPWVTQLLGRLEQHARLPVYVALGRIVENLVRQEARAGTDVGAHR